MKTLPRFFLLLAAVVAAAFSYAWADPPGRVGRISLVSGTVHLRSDYQGEEQIAAVNWPVTGGTVLITEPGSRAEVRIGSTAIRLDGDSELEFAALDDEQVHLRLLRGVVGARLRDPEQVRQFELFTPQGRATLRQSGAYRFEAGLSPEVTTVTVLSGAAEFSGEGLELSVPAGQRADIFGDGLLNYTLARLERDEFDRWGLERDRRDAEARSTHYVPPEMTGYEDLDDHGDWQESTDYGPLWYPRHVPLGWAPYSTGRWAWVAPWGWTWIDDAPWGFAPFHYGRWVLIRGLWAWTPGPFRVRPVFAPALVVWISRPGWQLSFGPHHGPAVGWFPLGPREVFVPAFRCSPLFVHRINAPHVTNIILIEKVRKDIHRAPFVHRANPAAVTIAPAHTLSRGEPVARMALRGAQVPVATAWPEAALAPAVEAPRRLLRPDPRDPGIPAAVPERERPGSPREAADNRPGPRFGPPPLPRMIVPGRPAAVLGQGRDEERRAVKERDAGRRTDSDHRRDGMRASVQPPAPAAVRPATALSGVVEPVPAVPQVRSSREERPILILPPRHAPRPTPGMAPSPDREAREVAPRPRLEERERREARDEKGHRPREMDRARRSDDRDVGRGPRDGRFRGGRGMPGMAH